MINTILLRRKNKIFLQPENHQLSSEQLATLLHNIQQLGYTLSPAILDIVGTFSEATLSEFYQSLLTDLKAMVGAEVEHTPMYPNFPKQVMSMSEAQLYFNAMVHYLGDWVGVRILPEYKKDNRPALNEKVALTTIDLATEEEFILLIKGLIGANTSISATDRLDIAFAIEEYKEAVTTLLPAQIPQKENLAFVTQELLKHTDSGQELIAQFFKTPTDVLRLAVSLSGGDVSLATATKFIKFKRPQRRLLLTALESCNQLVEDMLRYKKVWIRLGEILHPGEYKTKHPKAFVAFDVIRNNKPFETFNGALEKLFAAGDYKASLLFLVKRPGELARRLDFLIRNLEDYILVTNEFEKVASQVSTPVLLQVSKHFKHRMELKDLRVVFPKGNVGKAMALESTLPSIAPLAAKKVQQICDTALTQRFGQLSGLGKVYIQEELKNHLAPFSQRSASKSLRTLVRGSRIQMTEEKDTIRFFLWWKEGVKEGKKSGRVDIDLSAVLFDKDWNYKEHISYTNLKSAKYQAAHSGDITSAPDGACEFIDIDIPSVLTHGGRYVLMNVYSYTRQNLNTIPVCFGGWMMRAEPNSGEVFEPKTIKDKLDLTAESKICIPLILDLQERQMVWCDIALKAHPRWSNNLENNQRGINITGKAMTEIQKTNLFELFELHANGRGELVGTKEEADTIFSIDEGTTPFELEKIMSEYME